MNLATRESSRRMFAIMIIVTVTLSAGSAVPARATAPGENGRIAFRRYFNRAQTRGAVFTVRWSPLVHTRCPDVLTHFLPTRGPV